MKEMLDKAKHPLTRALAGKLAANATCAPMPKEAELDEVQAPQTTFYVLDADGAQRLCLEASARGYSFVMVGPSGSGKSQTITNMLADGMARGKDTLVVSDNAAALEEIAEGLRRAGLGGHVNPSPGDAPASLCQEASAASGEVDLDRLKKCHERLAAHVRSMHATRNPLGRSVWSALEEVTGLRGLPAYPLGLALSRAGLETAENLIVVTEVTPAWLEDAAQAMRRLQQLWPLKNQTDSPWRGFKADRHNKQLRDEVAGLLDRLRGRLDRVLTLGEQYGAQVGCKGPIHWLVKVAELLDTAPAHVPEHWLKTDLAQLAADLDRCADEYQRLGTARAPLTARYGPGIWGLAEGVAADVERAWQAVAPLTPAGDERGAGLFSQQQALRGWAADTQRRIPGWLTDARVLEKWLAIALPLGAGVPSPPPLSFAEKRPKTKSADGGDRAKGEGADPAPRHLRNLQRLANLCMSEYPPERTWVHDPAALEAARALIASARPVFADYHQRRRKLLEVYKESLFELDVPRLGAAFAGPYRVWWRALKGQFRKDRRAIRRRTHTLVVPRTMAEDMLTAQGILESRARLEGEGGARQTVLGRYEKGLDTNFELAERATRVAAEAVDLVRSLGYSALPARFVDVLCGGGAPPEKVRAAAHRLHDSLGDWQHLTQQLKAYLPIEAMPDTARPLDESALSVLNQYAKDLQSALNQFAAVTDPVLAHAPAQPPDAVSLAEDLHQAEEVRSWETSHVTEGPRWQAQLGPGFQGFATDWEAMRRALTWAKRTRDFFQGPPPEAFSGLACGEAGTRPSSQELRSALEQYEQTLHGFEHRFDATGLVFDGRRLAEHPPEMVKQRLAALRDRLGELGDWIDLRQLPIRLGHLGLGIFWEELQRNPPPVEQMTNIFRKAFWSCWLEAIVQNDPALSEFERTAHERTQADFRRLDRDWLRANGERVVQRIARGTTKPCRLMSCAEVALLPDEVRFDLLVFAGSEEMTQEDALDVIARGQQVIIAGDDTATAQEHAGTGPSVLDAGAAAGLPTYRLRDRSAGAAPAMPAPSKPDPLTSEILDILSARGYSVRTGFACDGFHINIAMNAYVPDRCSTAVLLDGPNYAAAATVRDRDRLCNEALERHGCKVHRIWALDWLRRREEEIERLCRALDGALSPG
jgi:hypothetical protein